MLYLLSYGDVNQLLLTVLNNEFCYFFALAVLTTLFLSGSVYLIAIGIHFIVISLHVILIRIHLIEGDGRTTNRWLSLLRGNNFGVVNTQIPPTPPSCARTVQLKIIKEELDQSKRYAIHANTILLRNWNGISSPLISSPFYLDQLTYDITQLGIHAPDRIATINIKDKIDASHTDWNNASNRKITLDHFYHNTHSHCQQCIQADAELVRSKAKAKDARDIVRTNMQLDKTF
jgi:hypothetical protein